MRARRWTRVVPLPVVVSASACAIGAPLPMRTAPSPTSSVEVRFQPPRDVPMVQNGEPVTARSLRNALAWVVAVRGDSVQCEVRDAASAAGSLSIVRGAIFWVSVRDTTLAMTPHADSREERRAEALRADRPVEAPRLLVQGSVVRLRAPRAPSATEGTLQRVAGDTLFLSRGSAFIPPIDTVLLHGGEQLEVRTPRTLARAGATIGIIAGAIVGYRMSYQEEPPCVPDPNQWFSCAKFVDYGNWSGVPGAFGGALAGGLLGLALGSAIHLDEWRPAALPIVQGSRGRTLVGLRVAF